MEHPDGEVNSALIRLADALCEWERSTGRQSVLILREQGGFERRYASGKPIDDRMVADQDLFRIIEG